MKQFNIKEKEYVLNKLGISIYNDRKEIKKIKMFLMISQKYGMI